MYKVKIYGAGSIGNHLAHAARHQGWQVDICDVDSNALKRTKEDIYPSRYGNWDEDIGLYLNDEVPSGVYDLIFIGTPPDSHISLALSVITEKPKLILIEKPVCEPSLKDSQMLVEQANKNNVKILVGYDHVVAKSTGTSNPHNMLKATFNAFKTSESPKSIAAKRSKKINEIIKSK